MLRFQIGRQRLTADLNNIFPTPFTWTEVIRITQSVLHALSRLFSTKNEAKEKKKVK